jgi:ribosomal protein S27AE
MPKKRKFLPFWMRWKISCPDCGFIIGEHGDLHDTDKHFDCPRCGVHYAKQDFWEEQWFKYSKEMVDFGQ